MLTRSVKSRFFFTFLSIMIVNCLKKFRFPKTVKYQSFRINCQWNKTTKLVICNDEKIFWFWSPSLFLKTLILLLKPNIDSGKIMALLDHFSIPTLLKNGVHWNLKKKQRRRKKNYPKSLSDSSQINILSFFRYF